MTKISSDALTTREIRMMKEKVGADVVDGFLGGADDALAIGASGRIEAMAAVHWVLRRRDDAGWEFDDSLDIPVDELAEALTDQMGDDDDPKSTAQSGSDG